MEKNWVITKSLTLTFEGTSYLNKNSYFYSYNAGKKNMAVIQIRVIIFFILNFFSEI